MGKQPRKARAGGAGSQREGERQSDGGPLTLSKGVHHWTFTCEPGGEPALLRRLSELAGDPEAPFDWFDAALVSHQLGKRLKPGLKRVEPGVGREG